MLFLAFFEQDHILDIVKVSDWGATHDSAADNANAGLDMEQPGDYILIGELRST